jgi:U3 small nucleolar RNA-associated protein 21
MCIHTFSPANLLPDGSKPVPITAIVQSHVADVVGVGFSSGIVIIHDIRADERILHVKMDGGAISAIAFRTDGQELLATSNITGNIALWDLNQKGRLSHIIRGAHDGPVASIQWIPNQPMLVSSGEDNSVKVTLFNDLFTAFLILQLAMGIRFAGFAATTPQISLGTSRPPSFNSPLWR